MFFHPKNLKSENNNPWFNILLHTQSIECATLDSQCLQYLGYITLPLGWSSTRLKLIIKISNFTFGLHIGGPECQVVPQQLHDQCWIFIAFFWEGVQIGDGIVKGCLGQATCSVGRIKDFIIENREIKCQTQPEIRIIF